LKLTLLLKEVHQVEVTVDGALSLIKDFTVASARACEYTLDTGLDIQTAKVKESTRELNSILQTLLGLLDHFFPLFSGAVLRLVNLGWGLALGRIHSEHSQHQGLDEEPRHEEGENVAEEELAEGK
jgi:hypothetical protein